MKEKSDTLGAGAVSLAGVPTISHRGQKMVITVVSDNSVRASRHPHSPALRPCNHLDPFLTGEQRTPDSLPWEFGSPAQPLLSSAPGLLRGLPSPGSGAACAALVPSRAARQRRGCDFGGRGVVGLCRLRASPGNGRNCSARVAPGSLQGIFWKNK